MLDDNTRAGVPSVLNAVGNPSWTRTPDGVSLSPCSTLAVTPIKGNAMLKSLLLRLMSGLNWKSSCPSASCERKSPPGSSPLVVE